MSSAQLLALETHPKYVPDPSFPCCVLAVGILSECKKTHKSNQTHDCLSIARIEVVGCSALPAKCRLQTEQIVSIAEREQCLPTISLSARLVNLENLGLQAQIASCATQLTRSRMPISLLVSQPLPAAFIPAAANSRIATQVRPAQSEPRQR